MSFKRRAGSIPALGTEKASPAPWGGFCHLVTFKNNLHHLRVVWGQEYVIHIHFHCKRFQENVLNGTRREYYDTLFRKNVLDGTNILIAVR